MPLIPLHHLRCVLAAGLGVAAAAPSAAGAEAASGPARVALLELYTSEGCSSCPPAEAWLAGLARDAELWTSFVPVAFHVDYWDRLGWKDPHARSEFTQRQRAYAAFWSSPTVYTPQMVWNGKDWQAWRRSPRPASTGPGGWLRARHVPGQPMEAIYRPEAPFKGGMAHAVLLSGPFENEVPRGENAGRRLSHGFVVLKHLTRPLHESQPGTWAATLPAWEEAAHAAAFAVWVQAGTNPTPLQAAGAWLGP